MVRRIMHVDMDAFYASIEQADFPELRGRPVIVGGSKRGVVSAASYEARRFGVHSAMPVFQARRLCPTGVFVPVRMGRYREVSRQVMAILSAVSPLVEPLSIDEAFIDITGTELLHGPPERLALEVKRAVFERTALTCSVGIAPNKFLAKIASDLKKPDGLTLIVESEVAAFLHTLPVGRLPGIGAKSLEILRGLGVATAGDILRFPEEFWVKRLGKAGLRLVEKARGIDDAPVVPHAPAKSCGAEDTFAEDTLELPILEQWLLTQSEQVGRSLRAEGLRGRTVTVKVKYADFSALTRSRTLPDPTDCTQVIFATARQLLREVRLVQPVRLIGVSVSNLGAGLQQAQLFSDALRLKHEQLDAAMDRIQERFGKGALKRGRLFGFKPT